MGGLAVSQDEYGSKSALLVSKEVATSDNKSYESYL